MQQKTCPVCSKPVLRKALTYCGMDCYSKARQKRIKVLCVQCKKEFEIRPFEKTRSITHYCSSCREHWENRKTPEKVLKGLWLQCFFCSCPVYRPPYYYRRYLYTFCSKECRRAGWRELRLAHLGLFGTKKDKPNAI